MSSEWKYSKFSAKSKDFPIKSTIAKLTISSKSHGKTKAEEVSHNLYPSNLLGGMKDFKKWNVGGTRIFRRHWGGLRFKVGGLELSVCDNFRMNWIFLNSFKKFDFLLTLTPNDLQNSE